MILVIVLRLFTFLGAQIQYFIFNYDTGVVSKMAAKLRTNLLIWLIYFTGVFYETILTIKVSKIFLKIFQSNEKRVIVKNI